MNLKKLLRDISDNNILLEVKEGKLQVFANGPSIDELLIGEIRANQQELVAFLSGNDQTDFDRYFTANIPPVPEAPDYALSSAQRRLWVLSQTTGASIAYIMARAYLFEGELDQQGLDFAFNQLLDRHESLRTMFIENEQREVRQSIYAPGEKRFPLLSFDWRNVEDAGEKLKERVHHEMSKPFSLSEGLLVRAAIFRVADEQYVFVCAMHHIISDGWSMGVLIKELLVFYKAYLDGEAGSLRPLPIQYKDYAAWQLRQLEDNGLEEHKAYWFRQFEGELPVLDLPGDRRRPPIKTYNGATVNRTIDAHIARKLRQLGQEQGATLFMTLLAAVKALFFRYTGQEDLIIGSPIAGREHIDLEDQIGFYVNMLALRTRFSGTGSFRQLLDHVRNTTLEAYAHQAYPFDELVHERNLGTDTSRHALFDVVVVLQNTLSEAEKARAGQVGKLTIRGYGETERVVSLFDLRIDFKEVGDELLTTIDYNSDIYNRSTIERLGDHLVNLVVAVAADADVALHQVDYLSAGETRLAAEAFLEKGVGYPEWATLIDLFESQVKKTPDAIALTDEETRLTYDELNRRANQVAHFLIEEAKLQREEGVGLLLDRHPDLIAAMIGVLKAGGMYIPFDPGTPEERLKFMVEDTGMKILLTEKALLERVNRLQWSCRRLKTWLCMDSLRVYEEKEREENVMMNQELWDHVGQRATDVITGGGWLSSYTGQPIPAAEMEEYALNAYNKLSGYLRPDMRVLEIGCSSGLTLSKIAPQVAFFYGTDLSPVILERTRNRVAEQSFHHVRLKVMAAHEIATLDEKGFDLIILNSVVQHFHGHNYLRQVIKDAIGLLGEQGKIFIGDVMDIERKEDLVADLLAFRTANRDKGFTTKTDFSADLFLAKDFFRDLMLDEPSINDVQVGDKLFTIANELTKFRYDVVLEIDKRRGAASKGERKKYQFGNEALLRQPVVNPALRVSPGDLAYVIYTSGTTGRPKGVMVQHDNVVRLFMTERPLFDFNGEDVWTLFHSSSFDFSVWEIYGALLFGGRLVLVPGDVAQDTSAYRALLAREGVTVLNQTPSAFYNLIRQELEQKETDLAVRYVIFGGEALDPGRLREWRERYARVRLINMYGITETTVHVTYKEIGEPEIRCNISNIGRPIPTLYAYVLDPYFRPLPAGLPGELYVGGKGVARGYLNREELTAERFIPDPFRKGERLYRSGDKVRILENGEMEYMGRMDDQVKIRGYRIEVAEIQHQLNQHESISESVVLVKEDDLGQKSLVAYVVSNESLTSTGLRDYLQSRLPDYMIPAYYVAIPQLPLTSNGKINKKALPHPEGLSLSTGVKYLAPRNRLENDLVRLFAAMLGIGGDRVGIRDNFFALGGDSIKAMRLVVEVKKQLKAVINIGDVYKYQCIEELAGLLAEEKGQDTLYDHLATGLKEMAHVRDLIRGENETAGALPLHYEDIYPVSRIEQGMIYSSLLNPGEPVYYDQFLFRLTIGDYDRFLGALRQMIRRHPILRTLYYTKSFSQPVKVVLPDIEVPIDHRDLTALSPDQQAEYVDLAIKQDQEMRYTFDDELFWRLTIFRTGETGFSILWSFHHSLLDGWSVSVFCKELTDLLTDREPPDLPVLPYSYKDYCAILYGRERTDAIEKYWRKLLGGYSRNKLPFNYKGLKTNGGHGMDYVSRRVDDQLFRRLNRLVSEHQLSFKGVCVAAHIYLLHILCSEPEVITGVVTHERPPLENSEYILGCFLNTIPIRIDVSRQTTILSLLKEVNRWLTDVKPYEVHLSEIARIMDEKTTSGNPIFDTILNYTDFHLYKDLNKETSVHSARAHRDEPESAPVNQMTNTLFDVEVGRTLDRFLVNIKYVPSYFNRSDVEYALDLYVRILGFFAGEVDMPLSRLDLLTAGDRQAIVYDFNATAAPYARTMTLQALFEQQVARTPDAIALRQDGAELSYGELNRQANRLAGALIGKGVLPGDNIGLLVKRSFDMMVGMLGILKAGAAYVPIDPEYPAERQTYIAENSAVRFLLTDEEIKELKYSNHRTDNPRVPVSPDALAYTIYTSGSTGRPKGVMIEHHSAINLIEWVNETFRVGADDRILFITSMCFDLSVYDIFGMLAAGGTIIIARQEEVRDPRQLKRLLTGERITFWDSVPTTLNYLVGELEADTDDYEQHSLRTVFLSGDWIPVHLPDRIRKFFPAAEIISLGGATEGTVWSNYYPIRQVDPLWSSIPYGKPIKNNSFYILDDQLRPVPRGVAGELFIGGAGVARGYANDREKTAHSFRADPFHKNWGGRMYKTGDLGRMMPDGNMEFLGRKDNQVKIRGYRVELGEIESTLCRIDSVKEAIVDVFRDAQNNNQLVAYLVLSGAPDWQAIKAGLKGSLPDYMIPNQYILLEALPLNSNGKMDRKALPKPTENSREEREYTAAVTGMEMKLEQMWKSILSLERISMKDDLFELGANSLSVGAFVNRVHRETDLQLSIRDVFSNPTLQGIVKVLQGRTHNAFENIRPAASQDSYPLSSYQRQLWVLSQFESNSLSYHIPGVYVFEGVLDRGVFEQSLGELIQRHEILRTLFREDVNGEVRQWVRTLEETSFRLLYRDLRQQDNHEGRVRRMLHQQFVTPFDLAEGPLIRAELIQLEEQKWIFGYTLHHIVSDGWSIGILIRELLALYNAAIDGIRQPLTPLRIQYKDYASWQQEQMDPSSSSEHRSYWQQQLSGELPVLHLPLDRPRPAVKTFNGATLLKYIDPALSRQLNQLVREQGATLFMGLLSIVNTLLFRYTHQQDMIIGSPVAGRDHADLESQIGFYVNTLPLRSRFSASDPFRQLLKHVKQVTLEGYAHQIYPFDELVYDLGLQRNVSRGTLFDVMVILQNTQTIRPAGHLTLGDLRVTGYDVSENTNSKFDLVFDFVETEKGIVARIEYNTDIYDKETLVRMADHMEQLVAAVIREPDTPIGVLDFLGADEKELLLNRFNDNRTPYPDDQTISRLFEAQVSRTPEATALIFGEETMPYRELNEHVHRLAAFLQIQYGIGANDAVGIKLERSPWLVIAILATIKAGGACVVVDPGYPAERIAYILGDSGCKTLIDGSTRQAFWEWSNGAAFPVVPAGSPGDLSFIVYTSGSTGHPKGCMLSHRGVINHLFSKINLLNLGPGDTLCHCSAFHFVGGIWQLLAPLITGGQVAVCTAAELKDIGRLLEIAHTHKARILEIIPSQLNEHLSQEERIHLGSIGTLILTGEKLSHHFVRKCYAGNEHATLFNTYGQTELSDVTTCYPIPREGVRENILAGRPIQNTAHFILSPSGSLCPIGVVGEICTSGDGIAAGYINDPVGTAQKFVVNPFRPGQKMYRTGDLGRWLPDGNLEVFGRKDEQVKIRGFRVDLREIEGALLQHPGVEEAAVLNLEKTGAEARLVAFLVGKDSLSASALRAFLTGKIPTYMLPSSYVRLESFPLLENGKTHKNALAQFAEREMESGVEYVAPETAIEYQLTAIWEEILQRGKIGVLDNFFELGGHSLKATTLMNKIKQAFGVRMNLRDVFQHATIKQLGEEIEKKMWMQDSRSMLQESSDGRDVIKI